MILSGFGCCAHAGMPMLPTGCFEENSRSLEKSLSNTLYESGLPNETTEPLCSTLLKSIDDRFLGG